MDDEDNLGRILKELPQAYEKWNPYQIRRAEKGLETNPLDPNARKLAGKLYKSYLKAIESRSGGDLLDFDAGIRIAEKASMVSAANKLKERYGLGEELLQEKVKEKKNHR